MFNIGKWLVILGVGIVVVGGLICLGIKLGIPIGKLPGDIKVQREKFTLYAPIVTSIVVSIILTIFINLFIWLFRK